MTTIYDYIQDIATELGLNYLHGSYKSIQQRLDESIKNGNAVSTRYPLLMFITSDLVQDVEVDEAQQTNYPLHLIIATLSKPYYTNDQRLQLSFKDVLIPIYDNIIEKIRTDSKNDYDQVHHKRKDHFFYSIDDNKTSNVLNEYLDAIEITDLSVLLNLNKFNCN